MWEKQKAVPGYAVIRWLCACGAVGLDSMYSMCPSQSSVGLVFGGSCALVELKDGVSSALFK